MRILVDHAFNRWIVAFSTVAMFGFAVLGGASRLFLERMGPDSRMEIAPPGLLGDVTLGVFWALFLTGMLANAGLLLFPLQLWRGRLSFIIMAIALLALIFIGGAYGGYALHVFVPGGSVTGGDG